MTRYLLSLALLFPALGGWTAAEAKVPAELQRLSRDYLKTGAKSSRQKLLAYTKLQSSSENKALAEFGLGMGDFEAKNYTAAAEHLDRAAKGLGDLAHSAAYHQVKSLVLADQHLQAIQAAIAFLSRFSESRFRGLVLRMQAESLIRTEQLAAAKKLLDASKNDLSEPVRLYLLARIEHIEGRLLPTVRAYRRVYYHYPLSAQTDDAESQLNILRRQLGEQYPDAPAKWRLLRGDALFGARKFAKASLEHRLAAPHLQGGERERALVRHGSSDYRRVHTTKAYGHLKLLKIADPELDAERIYYLGECARRLSRIQEFRERAEELAKKYPKSPWYEEALFSLGNFYLLKDQPEQYRKYYERAARAFPQGKYASKAHWKVCWRAYLDRDPRAHSLLEEHVQIYPSSATVSSAIYWLARLEEEENPGLARLLYSTIVARFPNYYYAGRAKERLNKFAAPAKPGLQIPGYLSGLPNARSLTEKQSPWVAALIGRGATLHALGLADLAAGELRTGDYRKADSHWIGLELARQYAERGQHHRALRSMKRYGFGYLRLPLDSVSREFWERLYPMPYAKQLRARAKPHNLDPYMVAGLIRQESEFNPSARSRAGALGLMQIMPRTGKGLARRLGIQGFSTRQLRHADTSLRLGTFHFRQVYDQFERRIEYTLAAYNAGEHRVDEWVTWEDFAEAEEFVETIPFTETRGYVQAVLRNAAVYRGLYGEGSQRASSTAAAKATPTDSDD
jgi:soluble lytic murein transglycosylase